MEALRSETFLFFFLLLFSFYSSQATPRMDREVGRDGPSSSPFKVGVIVDLGSPVGKITRLCMQIAVSDFYAEHPNYATRLDLHFRDSRRDTVTAASVAVDLLRFERVHAIIGPQTSDEAGFIVDLGNRVRVPIVSSATSPSLSPVKTPYFVRAALNDSFQAQSVAALQSEYGTGVVPYLVDAIKAVGARIPYRCVLPPSASGDLILTELYKLMNTESRVFLVHMSPALCSRFFAKVNQAGMMSKGFAWILSEGSTSLLGIMDPSVRPHSTGTLIGVKPYINSTDKLEKFKRRLLGEFQKQNPKSRISEPSVLGLWAYDTVWLMAMAAENVGAADPGYVKLDTGEPSYDLQALGVSKTGPMLLRTIRGMELTGLSGKFNLSNGQLYAPALEIVNLHRQQESTLGFWTPENGINRTMSTSKKRPSDTKADLSPAIWPGNTRVIPKGWVNPMTGKKLRVLVPDPENPGFYPLLSVHVNPDTDKTVISGYVFEMFEAAVMELPYALPIEYTTVKLSGNVAEYNDLVQMIFDQKYDALVGDVTITFNRSRKVDFTQPYLQSGVSMVVPLRDHRENNAWIFLKPLTPELWRVIGAFFFFTGAIVWILEHRVNGDFRGTPGHQFGTVLYFIFSTLVFSHKEKMLTNLSRVVVIIWLFVVFILQSNYVASLTSMLAVKHLEPTVTEIEELINRGEYVGYQNHSFTKEMLKDMGFEEEKLRPYGSPEEYQAGLAKGSKNGGVAAVIDEIPYLKVFLEDYCGNYSMAGRIHRVGGFGFVFPKGSPLVSDLSKGILNIMWTGKIREIEGRWFRDQGSCSRPNSRLTSDSLNLSSFWGLFLITGLATAASLLCFMFSFMYQHRQRNSSSVRTFWRRLVSVARHYDKKGISSHNFSSQANDGMSSNEDMG
ncbi:unnamed protein product [Spirodela intermedia]|uniref:Glutamate receptor n=1 Tax=Spirodela intermedia TaxID=51605 RepID=A0A7I8LDH9_SPIIN|nr:unnamed protein product [Spirodela intermedia]